MLDRWQIAICLIFLYGVIQVANISNYHVLLIEILRYLSGDMPATLLKYFENRDWSLNLNFYNRWFFW